MADAVFCDSTYPHPRERLAKLLAAVEGYGECQTPPLPLRTKFDVTRLASRPRFAQRIENRLTVSSLVKQAHLAPGQQRAIDCFLQGVEDNEAATMFHATAASIRECRYEAIRKIRAANKARSPISGGKPVDQL